MPQVVELKAVSREGLGKAEARRMRRLENAVPAVVYGGGAEPKAITLPHRDVGMALQHESTYSSILDLEIDGKKEKVVLKDLQRHPYKPKITHMDFMRVNANESIHMTVPLHFENEDKAVGVKEGGVLSHMITEVEIKCLPKDLPEFLSLDVAELGMEQSLHLSDISLPKGVEFAHAVDDAHNQPVVAVHKQRAAKAEEESTEAPEAPEAPEASAQKDDSSEG